MTDAAHPDDHRSLLPALERRALAWLGGLLVAMIAVVVLVVALFDWNWLRGPIARYASDATGREVRIDGDLKVHLLTWTPTVSVAGLKVGQPAWVGAGQMATVDKLVVQTRWKSLLQGRVVLPLLELDHPVLDLRRDAEGRNNWSLSKKPNSGPSKLPPIERFVVDGGHLHYADAGRKMVIDGTVDSNERAGGPTAHAFSLEGHGVLNAKPFQLRVQGGPLLNVEVDKPYPFSGTVTAGDTHVDAMGHLRRPFDLSAYTVDLHITGRDLADLYYLTGLTLPNTPPYNLRGELQHSAKLYDFDRIGGRIGASDLAGDFTVSTASGRPFVDARLRSHSLDFKDLNTLFGGAPSKAALAEAKPEVKAAAARRAAEQRLLPDAPLYADRLRKMDAKLDFRADSIKDSPIPLRSGNLKLTLDHGLLTVDPLNAAFPQGTLHATVALNGRGATPVTDLDARLTGLQIQNFVPGPKSASPPVEGTLAARAKLHGVGDSVHKAAAAADGAITVVVPHGHIRSAFAELLGVNVGKGLSLLLSKNKGESDVRCGIAAFDVGGGRATAREIVLDTDVVRVSGKGGANLGSETFDLVLSGDTKKFRVTHVFLPITIGGHFRNPQIGVQAGPAIAQGGIAVALGAVLSPLAAIIPFIDPGLAKNADCQALMSDAKSSPAPVKGALPTTPSKKK